MTISLLEEWHWHKYSKAHPKQSWIVLPCRKPYWFLWITHKITFCSLLDRTLVMNFIVEFTRDIGLKSVTLSGLVFFGTNVM